MRVYNTRYFQVLVIVERDFRRDEQKYRDYRIQYKINLLILNLEILAFDSHQENNIFQLFKKFSFAIFSLASTQGTFYTDFYYQFFKSLLKVVNKVDRQEHK